MTSRNSSAAGPSSPRSTSTSPSQSPKSEPSSPSSKCASIGASLGAEEMSVYFTGNGDLTSEFEEALSEHKTMREVEAFVSSKALLHELRSKEGSLMVKTIAELEGKGEDYCRQMLENLGDGFVVLFTHRRARVGCVAVCQNVRESLLCGIISDTIPHAEEFAIHKHATFVLQAMFKRALGSRSILESRPFKRLTDRIVAMGCKLVLHGSGNYTCQVMVPCLTDDQMTLLAQKISDNFVTCCSSRFGSHVVECLLKEGSDEAKAIMTLAVLQMDAEKSTKCADWKYIYEKAMAFVGELEKDSAATPTLRSKAIPKMHSIGMEYVPPPAKQDCLICAALMKTGKEECNHGDLKHTQRVSCGKGSDVVSF